MRSRLCLGMVGLYCSCLPLQSLATVLNTPQALIVNSGDTITLSGTIYKSVSIYVQAGGTITVPPGTPGNPDSWRLQLIAPRIRIEGTINATAASFNTQGQGAAGVNYAYGPNGSGYGGTGGVGYNNPNSGGPSYDLAYRENTGSQGIGNAYGGGGSIRLDAMSLTLTAGCQLLANAYQTQVTGGGGSGGCVLLNGISTYLSTYTVQAKGQQGQAYAYPRYSGGGGAGGRVRILRYASYTNSGGTITVTGGAAGGSGATAGSAGIVDTPITPVPTPIAPTLVSPNDTANVSQEPVFSFIASDPMLSQFLQYEIQIANNSSFSPIAQDDIQFAPFAPNGWAGVQYYASNVLANYYFPAPGLSNGTYYWRVRVTNTTTGVGWGPFSSVRSFTTTAINPPTWPVLLAPTNGQSQVSKKPIFQVLSSDPTGYTLTFTINLSLDPGLLNPKIFQSSYPGWDQSVYVPAGDYTGVTATCQVQNTSSYPDALQPGTTYYWQVVATNSYQSTSRSAIASFTTVALPATPTLLSPADQSVVTTKNPALTIQSTSPTGSPLAYNLELSSDSFQTIITFLSGSSAGWTQTQYASGASAVLNIPASYTLVPGNQYIWRATAYDIANDNWSAVSPGHTFRVITPPLLPQLVSPPDGFAAPNNQVAFAFSAVSDAGNTLTYRCQLSADQFQTTLYTFDQTQSLTGWGAAWYPSGAQAAFTLPASTNLTRGQNYWWRVQATDGVSWGAVSALRSFSVANALNIRSLKVYPNPAVARSHVQVALEISVDADVTLRVCNEVGKQVREYHFSGRGGAAPNVFPLDIGSYASGVYFCILEAKSAFGTQKSVARFAIVN